MKELTIEEKAKAYDEAKARISRAYNNNRCTIGFMYEIFPEFEENDDERIKREMISYFKQINYDNAHTWNGINLNKFLAWLEKQREENFIDKNLVKEEAHRIAWEYSKHYDPLLSKESWCEMAALDMAYWLEKQGYQKSADKVEPKFDVGDKIQYSKGCGTIMTIEKIENGEYIFGNNMGHITIESGNKWHLVEQNLAWSEEDKKMFVNIKACLRNANKDYSREIDWLKSLKPQPKNEWSEEDERLFNSAIWHLRNSVNKGDIEHSAGQLEDWLKSLKKRIGG